jgi:hypothetical protein
MPCNWREGGHGPPPVRRRRRSADDNSTLVSDDGEDDDVRTTRTTLRAMIPENEEDTTAVPFSESLSLFQSLQVLANEEEEMAFKNKTSGGESRAPFKLSQKVIPGPARITPQEAGLEPLNDPRIPGLSRIIPQEVVTEPLKSYLKR